MYDIGTYIKAIETGDIGGVRSCLADGAPLDDPLILSTGEVGKYTFALEVAILNRQWNVAHYLLDSGSRPWLKYENGSSLLYMGCIMDQERCKFYTAESMPIERCFMAHRLHDLGCSLDFEITDHRGDTASTVDDLFGVSPGGYYL